jgi:hypothetical protein
VSDDDWSDYESGPFCRHWSDPSYCAHECARCGHECNAHNGYLDDRCDVRGCDCEAWLEHEPCGVSSCKWCAA